MPKKKDCQLSIILPLLDAQEEIGDLFNCLNRQAGIEKSSIEIIIVNDGSSDKTSQQISKHQHLLKDYSKIETINHKKNLGHTITRRDGADAANGKFLTFIDKRCRPDEDYLKSFLAKKRNIIIGNPYMNKSRSLWGRVLCLVRKKIYYPYFNYDFEDIDLDYEAYKKFKNKGGGGSLFVLRAYFLQAMDSMPKGIHVNDDSLLVLKLSKNESILKTSEAKIEYLNRTGISDNIIHLYNRGPKFVDFYAKPGSRFFPYIVLLVIMLFLNVGFIFAMPSFILHELVVSLVLLFLFSIYLSEDFLDFLACVFLIPIAILSFSAGVIKGLVLKLFNKY